jgi:uncharacterized protein YkwD
VALPAVLAATLLAAAPPTASARGVHPHHSRRAHPARAPRRCANADTPATGAATPTMRAAVVCVINQQRAARRLPALQSSGLLDRSAQSWTDSMVASGVFSHGADFSARITAVGFQWSSAGENIGTGFATPRDVVNAWMASKDHCQNILDPTYRDVGTGLSRHPVGSWASDPSTWTQDFALPAGLAAPSRNYAPARRCPY